MSRTLRVTSSVCAPYLKLHFHQKKKIVFKLFSLSFEMIVTDFLLIYTQSAFTCSKLTIKTLEQIVKYAQS